MSLIDKSKVVYTCSSLTGVMLAYFVGYLINSNNPRMADHALGIDEAYWWEVLILLLGVFSMVVILISSLSHSYKTKRMKWRKLMIYMFPLAFVYAWKYGRKY